MKKEFWFGYWLGRSGSKFHITNFYHFELVLQFLQFIIGFKSDKYVLKTHRDCWSWCYKQLLE